MLFTPAVGWLLSLCLTQPAGIHILPEERTKSMQLLVSQACRHTVTQHTHRLDPGGGRPNPEAPSKHTTIHVGAEDRTSFCLQLSATSPEQLGKGSKVLPSARPAALPAKHNRHAVQLGAPSIFFLPTLPLQTRGSLSLLCKHPHASLRGPRAPRCMARASRWWKATFAAGAEQEACKSGYKCNEGQAAPTGKPFDMHKQSHCLPGTRTLPSIHS